MLASHSFCKKNDIYMNLKSLENISSIKIDSFLNLLGKKRSKDKIVDLDI